MKNYLLLFLLLINILVRINIFAQLPKDANGWTIFTPSTDTRIMYVSSSSGNDTTAQYYSAADTNIGANAFKPSGIIKPYRTIAAAYANVRTNYPDWILLKKGDTWYAKLPGAKQGRSLTEPMLYGAYGPDTSARPLLKTGSNQMISICCSNNSYLAIVGIHAYAHTRNPNSSEYVGPTGAEGIRRYGLGRGLHIEDCWFRFYETNVLQTGTDKVTNVVFRRNVVTDNYSTVAHSQGVYAANIDTFLMEENVFDHNGWFIQQIGTGNDKDSGQATFYNHNTYLVDMKNTTIRNNIFSRASSMGNKFTANSGPGSASDITIDNNLYIDGEIGIGIGGNDAVNPYRFKNISIVNNVMMDIGRSQPTNRTLSWYLSMDDWDGGNVQKNLFLHQPRFVLGNTFAIDLIGVTRNVTIQENIIHGMYTGGELLHFRDKTTMQNIVFKNNNVQSSYNSRLVDAPDSLYNYTFQGNTYYSGKASNDWFKIGGINNGFSAWQTTSAETGAVQQYSFPDSSRTIETYHASLGKTATIEAFIAEAIQQSKNNWRHQYTACVVNNYMRTGFGMFNNSVSVAGATLTANAIGGNYQWLDCNSGYAPISGANSQQFTPVANGNYAVAVTVSGGCVDTSACVNFNYLGITSVTQENLLSIYPNPNTGEFVIIINHTAHITITDALGKQVYSQPMAAGMQNIKLKTETAGIYFIKVISDNQQIVHRMLIQK